MKEPWERKDVLFGIRLYCFGSLCLNLCPHWFSTPGIPVSIFGCPRSGEGTGLLVSTAWSPEVLTTLLHAQDNPPQLRMNDLIQKVNDTPAEKLLFPSGDSVPIPQMGDVERSWGFLFVFVCFWLHWVFIAGHRLPLVVANLGYSLLWFSGSSLW